jgi:hypothetical protein
MAGATPVRAEIRLRVLNSLPQRHRDYFCAEIRVLCGKYIASLGTKMIDRPSETFELLSEVMIKILGQASRHDELDIGQKDTLTPDAAGPKYEKETGNLASIPTDWSIDDHDPKRDGRVAWLISEVGGMRALSHRYEDMRRQRWGRWQDTGYRTVQISALQSHNHSEAQDEGETIARFADGSIQLQSDPEEPRQLDDTRLAWIGLLVCAQTQFPPDDDVSVLLDLLAHDPDVQAGFGSEWPVTQIVQALNAARPARAWDDHRIENAKKRLRNWIGRLKRDQGLDMTDLLALFVRYARESKQSPAGAPITGASSSSARRKTGETHA